MDTKAKLIELVEASLPNSSLFLVEVGGAGKNFSKISVILDGDNGVTIDDCTQVSRSLSEKLDEIDLGLEHYVLEVSTPGLDQPLKLKRQFRKNKGRSLKVVKKDKSQTQGILVTVEEDKIVLAQEIKEGKNWIEKEEIIPFEDIERAFVMVSFK